MCAPRCRSPTLAELFFHPAAEPTRPFRCLRRVVGHLRGATAAGAGNHALAWTLEFLAGAHASAHQAAVRFGRLPPRRHSGRGDGSQELANGGARDLITSMNLPRTLLPDMYAERCCLNRCSLLIARFVRQPSRVSQLSSCRIRRRATCHAFPPSRTFAAALLSARPARTRPAHPAPCRGVRRRRRAQQ